MDGFLNVLKPSGVTSHDVVALSRRLFREDRIGHLGTLDPLAIGVLPLACGAYRRLSEYFLCEDKSYFAEFTFGMRTDTGDTDGAILAEKDAARLDPREVEGALRLLTGRILQSPPAYSALKVKGEKLVNLARQGIAVKIEPREVTIHEFSLSGWIPGFHPKGLFSLRVGRGAYVRSLAFSLGDQLGFGATVSYLCRVRSGKFLLKDSLTVPRLRRVALEGRLEEALVDPTRVLPDYPGFTLKEGSTAKVSHGVGLEAGDLESPAGSAQEGRLARGPFPFRAVVFMPAGGGPRGPSRLDPRDQPGKPDRPGEVAAVVTVRGPGEIVYDKVLIAE